MFEHKSGLPYAYDRAAGDPETKSLVFHGRRPFIQAAELNEIQTVQRGVHNRLSRLVAKDGDRIEHAAAFVDVGAGTVTLTAGSIYVSGDVYPVAEAVLSDVAMTGRVDVGVRLQTTWITYEDDPTLLGLVPGSLAEGEPGAAREKQGLVWALVDDDQPGDFFAVYTLQDGTILDQTGPSMLEPVMQQLAIYDRPNGHYVVSGCRVTGLGANAGAQEFSIEQGEANISGFKRTRLAALRLAEPEDWDEGAVPGETHLYPGGASHTFAVDQFPIGVITQILLTREKTVVLTRGAIANGQDGMPDAPVIEIVSIVGYTLGVDYQRVGNSVDWGLPGAEPAGGSTYSVTYRYRANVAADSQTDREITVSGGAAGGDIIVSYTAKLPRVDRIGLREDGSAIYIKGISARANPVPPIVPGDVLALATVANDWMNRPVVTNEAVRSIPYADMWRYFNRVVDHERLIQLERIKSGIDAREPVAKKGMFVDPFIDDTYRDEGTPQTAAVGNGILQLAIATTIHPLALAGAVSLDFTEEVIAAQDLKTGCVKINPYANFTPLPGSLALDPPADFWTDQQTEWLSAETIQLNMGTVDVRRSDRDSTGPLTVTTAENRLIDQRSEQLEFLREIPVSFSITGFGPGEVLSELWFDSVSVLPAGPLAADGSGELAGTFDIPPNVTAGTKTVTAVGGSGTEANALFTGMGTIDIQTMRRVTTIQTWTKRVVDPQAQLFAMAEPRQLIGVDFHLCAIGDEAKSLLVEQVATDNGYPTTEIEAQAAVSMVGAAVGWKSARYPLPVIALSDRRYAFVIKTDDNEHSVSFGRLGDFDQDSQKWVSSHPYVVGPRFDSVNAETWTAHQAEALTFRLIAAKFAPGAKVVDLGTVDLVACSDLQIRAAVELPSAACSVVFEIERTNGTIYRLLPFQLLELTEHITETVEVRAVLTGTEKLSPILYAPIELIAGNIANEGTYVTRAMALGDDVRLTSYLKAYLPGGATLTMERAIDAGAFEELPFIDAEPLAYAQWTERKHEESDLTGTNVRLKITVTGGPAARVIAGDFGVGIF